ncbi:hypothetical protein ACFSBZ_04690 [Amnibacterium flavum]|uniref:Uncharacterized protein n=1 Tax=Amnibacterium flavum TaxID=2173173 RepID=A0A2V1HTB8_9MICO|nr:hypothetical protein [Amnibacterium flavum]PVZ94220.1 hypothetical protein DDQ50_10785 [Amnibacterium flavum]
MSNENGQPGVDDIEIPETGEATFWRDGVQHTIRADGSEDAEPTWTLHAEEALIAHISRREGKFVADNFDPSRQVVSDDDWRQVVAEVIG